MSYPETLSELANYPKALSHAESGGFKILNIKNNASAEATAASFVVNGKMDVVTIPAGETVACAYVEPADENTSWNFEVTSSVTLAPSPLPTGVGGEGESFYIEYNAEDGATLEFNESAG